MLRRRLVFSHQASAARVCVRQLTGSAFAAKPKEEAKPSSTSGPPSTPAEGQKSATTATGKAPRSRRRTSEPPVTAADCFRAIGMVPASTDGQYTAEDIKANYRAHVLVVHPDVPNGNDAEFRNAKLAFERLQSRPNDRSATASPERPRGFYDHPHADSHHSRPRRYPDFKQRTENTEGFTIRRPTLWQKLRGQHGFHRTRSMNAPPEEEAEEHRRHRDYYASGSGAFRIVLYLDVLVVVALYVLYKCGYLQPPVTMPAYHQRSYYTPEELERFASRAEAKAARMAAAESERSWGWDQAPPALRGVEGGTPAGFRPVKAAVQPGTQYALTYNGVPFTEDGMKQLHSARQRKLAKAGAKSTTPAAPTDPSPQAAPEEEEVADSIDD